MPTWIRAVGPFDDDKHYARIDQNSHEGQKGWIKAWKLGGLLGRLFGKKVNVIEGDKNKIIFVSKRVYEKLKGSCRIDPPEIKRTQGLRTGEVKTLNLEHLLEKLKDDFKDMDENEVKKYINEIGADVVFRPLIDFYQQWVDENFITSNNFPEPVQEQLRNWLEELPQGQKASMHQLHIRKYIDDGKLTIDTLEDFLGKVDVALKLDSNSGNSIVNAIMNGLRYQRPELTKNLKGFETLNYEADGYEFLYEIFRRVPALKVYLEDANLLGYSSEFKNNLNLYSKAREHWIESQ